MFHLCSKDSVEVEGVEGGEEVKMERETVALHPEGGVGCRPAGTRVTTTRSLWATNRTIVEVRWANLYFSNM